MRVFTLLFIFAALMSGASGQTAETMTVKVYFHNEKMNPGQDDCRKVFPVERQIPKTQAVATAALLEFLKGPTTEEQAREYWGFSSPETDGILKSINVKNGGAYVNFTKLVYEQMGSATSSCGGGFFSSIDKTLMQFPTINHVYYAIDGNTNDFYEWVQVGECPLGKKHCASSNFK